MIDEGALDFLLQDMTQGPFWIAALQIIFVNLILSGDNAVVIAMACLRLPQRQRRWGMILGTGVAVLMRFVFALVIAQALHFLLDEPVSPPSLREERGRLADRLQVELDALTERIALLEGSRQQLTRFVSDIRGEVVGPPKPPAPVEHDVGPAVRRAARR